MCKDADIHFPEMSQEELHDGDQRSWFPNVSIPINTNFQSLSGKKRTFAQSQSLPTQIPLPHMTKQQSLPSFTIDNNHNPIIQPPTSLPPPPLLSPQLGPAQLEISNAPWTMNGPSIEQKRANIMHGDRVLIKDVNGGMGNNKWGIVKFIGPISGMDEVIGVEIVRQIIAIVAVTRPRSWNSTRACSIHCMGARALVST